MFFAYIIRLVLSILFWFQVLKTTFLNEYLDINFYNYIVLNIYIYKGIYKSLLLSNGYIFLFFLFLYKWYNVVIKI